MGLLQSWTKAQREQQSSNTVQPVALGKNPLRAYEGNFNKAFARQKDWSGKAEHLSKLKASDKLNCGGTPAEGMVDRAASAIDASMQACEKCVVDSFYVARNASSPKSPRLNGNPCTRTSTGVEMPLDPRCLTSSVHPNRAGQPVSVGTQTSNCSIQRHRVRRSNSLSILHSPQLESLIGGAFGTNATLEPLKLRLLLDNLAATQPITSTGPSLSPDTPSSTCFDQDSRPDSGVGLPLAGETHLWKRAYHVQQQTLQEQMAKARKAETSLAETKKMLNNVQDTLSNVLSMSQRLQAEQDELKAQKSKSPATSALENTTLLKSRLEQRDQECSKLQKENQCLQVELMNTRYAKNIADCQVAESQGKYSDLGQNVNPISAGEIAKYKCLYEKECVQNIQLRSAMEEDPRKTAGLDKTVKHMQNSLEDCQGTNNEQVKTILELEKKIKSDKAAADAELKAAAAQNDMLSNVAHEFCKRKNEILYASNVLVDQLSEGNTNRKIAQAIIYFVDTVNYERRLEALIEKGATQFTAINGEKHFYESLYDEHVSEIEEAKTNYQLLEMEVKQYENKVTQLEVDINHRWDDISKEASKKDATIRELQSRKQQIEAALNAAGLDGVAQWFLDSKDQEIKTLHSQLAAAKERIETCGQDLCTKEWSNRLDAQNRRMEIEVFETYPHRLEVAEKELTDLRAKILDFETQHNPQNWIDLQSHTRRVDEVRAQTKAEIINQVREEVGPQVKAETEQTVLKNWVEPLQTLGSYLWRRVARFELPVIEGGLNVWDQERSILYEQSRRLHVGGADVSFAAAGPPEGPSGPQGCQGQDQGYQGHAQGYQGEAQGHQAQVQGFQAQARAYRAQARGSYGQAQTQKQRRW